VAGSVHEPFEARTPSHVERAHTLRRIDLVPGHGEEIDSQLVHAGGDLPRALGRIRVAESARSVRHGRDLGDGLDGPDLVVRMHHRDENGSSGAAAREDDLGRIATEQRRHLHPRVLDGRLRGRSRPATSASSAKAKRPDGR